MKILSALVICLCLSTLTFAQKLPSSPMTPSQVDEFRRQESMRVDQSFEKIDQMTKESDKRRRSVEKTDKFVLSPEQKARISPLPEDTAKYKSILANSNTGLVKIFPDLGCASQYVVNVGDDCQSQILFGSSYSFRHANRIDKENADINLYNNQLIGAGTLSHIILADLGDVPVEDLSLASKGISFLVNYKPAKQSDEATVKSKELKNGIDDEGFNYSNKISVRENTTYAARAIAYRIPVKHFYDFYFNSNKRKDVIVVFRVVRKESDGALTLLWRELKRKDAPEIKVIENNQAVE
jgi:hypothetical protein